MSAAVHRVLNQLLRVRQTKPGSWIACCPAHEDRSPSLSVRESEDGRVLLKCFGGCSADAVVKSMGLKMGDLFERPLTPLSLPALRGGLSARELLELLQNEATVVAIAATDMEDRALSAEEIARVRQAAGRIGLVMQEYAR